MSSIGSTILAYTRSNRKRWKASGRHVLPVSCPCSNGQHAYHTKEEPSSSKRDQAWLGGLIRPTNSTNAEPIRAFYVRSQPDIYIRAIVRSSHTADSLRYQPIHCGTNPLGEWTCPCIAVPNQLSLLSFAKRNEQLSQAGFLSLQLQCQSDSPLNVLRNSEPRPTPRTSVCCSQNAGAYIICYVTLVGSGVTVRLHLAIPV